MDNCNILLQIDGVKGSSTLADYADQIECYSWTFNVVQPSSNTKSGTERTAANPMFSDITLTKETDVSSTDLLRLCATAKEADKVTITMLRKVIISHYTIASAHEPHPLETGVDGARRPLETISLNFVKIKMEYNHQTSDGSIAGKTDFGYDLAINKKA
jgi:type VI secretion system secreted protein Hcp